MDYLDMEEGSEDGRRLWIWQREICQWIRNPNEVKEQSRWKWLYIQGGRTGDHGWSEWKMLHSVLVEVKQIQGDVRATV